MNNIDIQYEKIKKEKRMGLMTHVVVGYPSIPATRAIVKMMAEEGADFIELQIPFSDPLGDGPVIHQANTKALTKGIRVRDAFALVKTLREKDRITIPLLFMTYMNIPFSYGLEKFCKDAESADINGLIIPDYNLKLEGIDHFEKFAEKYNQILIRFVSLESASSRMKLLSSGAKGFIYCFSTQGITGVREHLEKYLTKHLGQVRRYFSLPLAVGFGISNAEHIRSLKGSADIVVVGSAMIKAFEEGGIKKSRIKIRELVDVCKNKK
ncbi:tryptophan synthase subunit alpha [Candidatus Nomurabacteria bacterium RIFCSPLOWO2_02_FULL_40_10]|uniref:Tryptophan synthase alpha chain n=1 Tax=Candidatus Nomurabacteria bacterium RIFCSPLOWO2_02_FULL_40_10 TaxID=1801786 RepID=A0A1F6Y0E9_9BACT|nr:MAG: tryptophan synthase subunit alpha [Candidatus Nomurabacteria bacterium RIFCSPLOWO2_02_FULL_40_10]